MNQSYQGVPLKRLLIIVLSCLQPIVCTTSAQDLENATPLLTSHCADCHNAVSHEGGLDLSSLSHDLTDPGILARWVRIHDRISNGEMPPADANTMTENQRARLLSTLTTTITRAHDSGKGTVLRRLNRREYENTMNDLFGTNLQLQELLPEDGRSHGFDTIGEALSISAVQMQRYLEAAEAVIDAAIVSTIAKPQNTTTSSSYADTRGGENFLGKNWLQLDDGAVVFFRQWGYPTGMLRETNVRTAGRYRIRVNGYAYQSDVPVTFSISGTTFQRGVEQPNWGYYSMPVGNDSSVHTVEIETWIESNYMVRIEPWGIDDAYEIKNKGIENYRGPGLAIKSIEVEGPLIDEWPLRGHKLLFDGLDRQEVMPRNPRDRERSYYKPTFALMLNDAGPQVTSALKRVATAAFRRDVNDAEVKPFVELFLAQQEDGISAEEAYRAAVVAIFCSPDFLFLKEPARQLNDHQLASRLSYALTRTSPDTELSAAADQQRLCNDPAALRIHASRFMQSTHFDRFVTDFTDSWLNLREIEFTNPDKALFPEFDEYLQHSMVQETRAFLKEIVTRDLPVTSIVKSDFAMLNERLAEHYGIVDVDGPQLRVVPLPEHAVRGGFLTQGAVLKVSANGNHTSPVVRGVFVMERILGQKVPPPPPGVPGVEPDIRGATTLRELLDKHRNVDSCRSCHQMIDPPGFALESFDPVGLYRDRFRSLGEGERVVRRINGNNVRYKLGPSVDATGALPDGRTFDSYVQFRELLASDPHRLAKAFVTTFLTFSTGREMGFSDRAEIERITSSTASVNYGIRSLILASLDSSIFRRK
ncbi:MAG: DUF1592 domain-containing protein [Planctomycetaceae bacterium]